MIRFEYKLRPVETIHPWGTPPDLKLHWFGFTDGFYRLEVGNEYLLNYSAEFVQQYPLQPFNTTMIDYYVVRLWEDMLEILPAALQPLPTPLAGFFELDQAQRETWWDKARGWLDHQLDSLTNDDKAWEMWDKLVAWQSSYFLNTGYLHHAPHLWLWSTDAEVVLSWDNQNITENGVPVWSAKRGNYRVPRGEFIEAIRAFDKTFMTEMNQRVQAVCQHWTRSEIAVDFDHLKQEQLTRPQWLNAALERKPVFAPPEEILAAVEFMGIGLPSKPD